MTSRTDKTNTGSIGRVKRAREIAATPGRVKALGGERFAVSGSGHKIYIVDIEAGTCECEDHAHCGETFSCKHILAVEIVVRRDREAAAIKASGDFFHAMRARKREAMNARLRASGREREIVRSGVRGAA